MSSWLWTWLKGTSAPPCDKPAAPRFKVAVAYHIVDSGFDHFFASLVCERRMLTGHHLGMDQDAIHVISVVYAVDDPQALIKEVQDNKIYAAHTTFSDEEGELCDFPNAHGASDPCGPLFPFVPQTAPEGNLVIVWDVPGKDWESFKAGLSTDPHLVRHCHLTLTSVLDDKEKVFMVSCRYTVDDPDAYAEGVKDNPHFSAYTVLQRYEGPPTKLTGWARNNRRFRLLFSPASQPIDMTPNKLKVVRIPDDDFGDFYARLSVDPLLVHHEHLGMDGNVHLMVLSYHTDDEGVPMEDASGRPTCVLFQHIGRDGLLNFSGRSGREAPPRYQP